MPFKSRQRSVSSIEVPKPQNAADRSSGCKSDADDGLRVTAFAQVAVRRHADGFTVVELMIALIVAVVLIVIAVPSFRTITLSNKLTTAANDLVGAINIARVEAIKLNAGTQFCSNLASNNMTDPLGNACANQTGAVYALVGGTPTPIRAETIGISPPLQLSGDMTALRFSTAGLGQRAGTTTPYSDTVVDICTSAMNSNNHRRIDMAAGSIITTTTTTGACPG